MKKYLIAVRLSVSSIMIFGLFVFLYTTSIRSMPNLTNQLPSSFPSEPVSPTPQTTPDGENAQSQPGPDNIAISDEKAGEQGNWVKKKQWLLKSFELNNNIYNLALQIADTRNIYSTKNDSITDEFQAFYKNLGLGEGKLQETFESIERYLEKKKKMDITVLSGIGEKKSESDRDFQVKIELIENQVKHLKDELEQFKLDMKSIEDIGKSLNQRLEKVDEQISAAMNLAETAKGKVERLWEIIDDKKARIIYYELASIEENLKAIFNYLKNTLENDFESVMQTAKKQIEVTNTGIKKLEDRGIIIKDRSSRVEQLKLQELQKIEREKETSAKQEQIEKKLSQETKKTVPLNLWQRLYAAILEFSSRIYKFFSLLSQNDKNMVSTDKKIEKKDGLVTTTTLPIQTQRALDIKTTSSPDTSDIVPKPIPKEVPAKKPQVEAMQLIQ